MQLMILNMMEELVMLVADKPFNCLFELISFNPSISICWKGCDFGRGRVNDNYERKDAQKMCKAFATKTYPTYIQQFGYLLLIENLEDLRIHPNMYPNNPVNVYKVCLAGIRRQRY